MKARFLAFTIKPYSWTLLTLCAIITVACTSARFTGSQKKNKNNDSGQATSATGGDGTGGTATGGEETGGTATAGTTPTPTIPISPASCKDSDFILPDWPAAIAACVDQGHIFNFDKNTCSKIPKASFSCNWAQILHEEDRVLRGQAPTNRIGSLNRESWSKIVGCGEHEDANYHILVLQYWTAKNEKDLEKCEMAAGWNIHTSCRIFKKSKDLADLKWQNCLDYQP